MLVETLLLLALALLLVYQIIRRRWLVLKKWNIPHEPPSLLNLGHAALMYGKNAIDFELGCKNKFGNTWGYYVFTRPRIIIHDPEIIRQIMVKEFSSFQNRFRDPAVFENKEMQQGILAAHWKQWRRMRSTLSPTFSTMKMKGMSGIVIGCINNTLLRLGNMSHSKLRSVDIKDLFNKLSLNVICSTVFSADVNSQDDTQPEPEISKHAKLFFEHGIIGRIRVFLNISFPFLQRYLGEGERSRSVTYLRNVCRMMMTARDLEDQDNRANVGPRRSDIMEAMINARKTHEEMELNDEKGLTDSEIVGNAITMLLAGYDTTAVAMTYLAYNLAFHSDVQEQLQGEIDKAFPEGTEVDFKVVSNLKYLDMCINESMRLYCPVARTLRCASRDVTVNDLKIPKGVTVAIPLASLCRDPEYWVDPMSFKPERMRDVKNIDPTIYQPFGNGPRNCIGSKFAFMEIKLAFCEILRKYTFKPTKQSPRPPLILKQLATTSPANDIKLELSLRKLS